jgi:AcrR family transcriptional regulator
MNKKLKVSYPKPKAASGRRRGRALEQAIFDAVWAEIAAVGYAGLTMDAVAARAETSKPVLYRRWDHRAALVLAALRDRAPLLSGEPPDTGSLRGDVIELLRRTSQRLKTVGADTIFGLFSEFIADRKAFAVLRSHGFGAGVEAMRIVLDRARARGEISAEPIPERIATLPVDLARNEMLVTRTAVSEKALAEIVDEVFLPLVHGARTRPASGR